VEHVTAAKMANDEVGPRQLSKLRLPVKRGQSIVGSWTTVCGKFLKSRRQFITIHDKAAARARINDRINRITACQSLVEFVKYFISISQNPLEFSGRVSVAFYGSLKALA